MFFVFLVWVGSMGWVRAVRDPPREGLMFKNYLTVAIRNIARYKVYSFINIASLSIGMACCALILLSVQYELQYDAFHSKSDRIYRVLREARDDDGRLLLLSAISGPFTAALMNDVPEVENAVRFVGSGALYMQIGDQQFDLADHKVLAAESSFLDVFDFSLIVGDRETALREPYSVALSEEAAQRFFGSDDPLGKVITLADGRFPGDYTVTGVVAVPEQSSLKFGMVTSFHSTMIEDIWLKEQWEKWHPAVNSAGAFGAFVVLREGVDRQAVEAKLPAFIERYMGKEVREGNTYWLQPLLRIHLYTRADYAGKFHKEPVGVDYSDIQLSYLFSVVAFLIMVIACVNFMNLATARSANRAREVGMRKVSGAHRIQLVQQFLGEAILLSFIAFVFALGLVELTLPAYSEFVGKDLAVERNLYQILMIPGFVAFVGLVAGIYPAFFLSAFEPVAVLKGQSKTGLQGVLLRRGLVVFQFAMSILLIIGTVTAYRQLHYIQNKDLGYQKDQLIGMPIFRLDRYKQRNEPEKWLSQRYTTVKRAFLEHPNVLNATAYLHGFGYKGGNLGEFQTRSGDTYTMQTQAVDEDFIETMKMDLISGRSFYPHEMTGIPSGIILNETAVKMFGWDDPIGKQLMALRFVEQFAPLSPAHFALQVSHDAFYDAVEVLTSARLLMISEIRDSGFQRQIYFRDGDGNLMEIIAFDYIPDDVLPVQHPLRVLYMREIGFPVVDVERCRIWMMDVLGLKKSENSSEQFGFMVGGTAHAVVVDQKRPWIPIGMRALPQPMRLVWGTPRMNFLETACNRLIENGVAVTRCEGEVAFECEGYRLGLRYTPDFLEDFVAGLKLPKLLDH